jgi:hypothetical protein
MTYRRLYERQPVESFVVCVVTVTNMLILYISFNPFQSNVSANRTLPTSYLFWAGKREKASDILRQRANKKRKTVSEVFRHWSGTGKSYCLTSFGVGSERVKNEISFIFGWMSHVLEQSNLVELMAVNQRMRIKCYSSPPRVGDFS